MSNISYDTVQAFLNKYRKGFYARKEFGYCVAYNVRYGWKVTASSWYTLLLYLCERHDIHEVKLLLDQGISPENL